MPPQAVRVRRGVIITRMNMKWPILLAIAVAAGSCATAGPTAAPATPMAPAGVTYAGGDGRDCQRRVLIRGANFETGIQAEYAWLKAKYPGFKREGQTLVECGGAQSDRIDIVTEDGHSLALYFDVSDFFGKGLLP